MDTAEGERKNVAEKFYAGAKKSVCWVSNAQNPLQTYPRN